jgi:hypothetical protein
MHADAVVATTRTSHHHLQVSESPAEGAVKTETLPFTVKIVHEESQLAKAVRIRYSAYNRHVPEFAQQLWEAEPYDREDGSVVLIAESKLDGEPLGTMRIQSNRFKPLNIETSVELPDWLRGQTMAQASRLGIGLGGIGRMVKIALFKAYYLYCVQAGIGWMVIAARPPLDKQYSDLLFTDVYPDLGYVPIKHAKGIPHRVMAFDVPGAEKLWREKGHPLLNFVVRTNHPDIDTTDRGMPGFRNPLSVANSLHAMETAPG